MFPVEIEAKLRSDAGRLLAKEPEANKAPKLMRLGGPIRRQCFDAYKKLYPDPDPHIFYGGWRKFLLDRRWT